MTNLVIMKDQQAVTTSLQVAETFNKEHKNVLQTIVGIVENLAAEKSATKYFAEGTYENRGKEYPLYYMNRDGFTLLVMGFTGNNALQFKLKYIEAFNKMENHIKQQLDTSKLSPELQMFQGLFQATANNELAIKNLDNKMDNITEIVSLNSLDWRKNANSLINQVVRVHGGGEAHRTVRNDIYKEVERRAGANLSQRVTNKRRRMADEGICKSKRDKLNQVDVIADDKKLVEIYLSVVKDFAIKYQVWSDNF